MHHARCEIDAWNQIGCCQSVVVTAIKLYQSLALMTTAHAAYMWVMQVSFAGQHKKYSVTVLHVYTDYAITIKS